MTISDKNQRRSHSHIKFYKNNDERNGVLFETTVFINGFGTFFIELAPELMSASMQVKNADHYVTNCTGEQNEFFVCGDSLNRVKNYIEKVIECYSQTEIHSQFVIQIRTQSRINYLVTKEKLYASDSDYQIEQGQSSYGTEAKRLGQLAPLDLINCFGVDFSARIVEKVTHKNREGLRTEYRSPLFNEDEKWGKKLNSFEQLSLAEHTFEFAYSEELAKSCYQLMMQLAQLDHAIRSMVCNAENKALTLVSTPLNVVNG